MIVLVITMIVAAMATPNVARGITVIRLRSGVSSVAGLVQKARIEAVRSNTIQVVRKTTDSDGVTPVYYVDGAMNPTTANSGKPNQTNSRDAWEPMITTSRDLTLESSANAPSFDTSALLGYSASRFKDPPMNLAFTQRGLPCNPNSTTGTITTCNLIGITQTNTSDASYQYFFRMRSVFGDRWASLTVTPAGRVRVWVWNGTVWK
jgi:Tfp pilus assembly protein FimT